MDSRADEQLRRLVRGAIRNAEVSQAHVARELGLSTKHMSQMLTGRAVLSIPRAEQILRVCGMRLVVGMEYVPD